jgi:hypothetical protein
MITPNYLLAVISIVVAASIISVGPFPNAVAQPAPEVPSSAINETISTALESETEKTTVYLVVCPPGATPEQCEITRLA